MSANCVLTSTEVKELEPSFLSSILYSDTPLTLDLENFNIPKLGYHYLDRNNRHGLWRSLLSHFLNFAILTCALLKPLWLPGTSILVNSLLWVGNRQLLNCLETGYPWVTALSGSGILYMLGDYPLLLVECKGVFGAAALIQPLCFHGKPWK